MAAWEKNISTRLNEKLQIRDNDSVNNRVLRSAHKYVFTGQIVGFVVTIKCDILTLSTSICLSQVGRFRGFHCTHEFFGKYLETLW